MFPLLSVSSFLFLIHTFILFPSFHSSSLLFETLTKATSNTTPWRSYEFTHTLTLILGKIQADNIQPIPIFFYLFWLSLSSPQTLSCLWSTNRKHCCENAVLMCGVCARSVWIKRKLVTVVVWIQRKQVLRDFRDVILLRRILWESDHVEYFWSSKARVL